MTEAYVSFIAWYNVLATYAVACTLLLYLTHTFYSTDVFRIYLLEIESNEQTIFSSDCPGDSVCRAV